MTGMPKRWIVVLMCFLATTVCYVDRVNISVAVIPMAEQFHWSGTTKGLVLSSFFVGYLIAMLPGGWLVARYGGAKVLGVALAGWSLMTLLTPSAAWAGFPILIAARIAMGMAEAATFPAAVGLFGRWLPRAERSRAVGFNLGGIAVGTIIGSAAAAAIVQLYGWPVMFWIFGALGLIFATAWFALVRNGPDDHPRLAETERAMLAARPVDPGSATVPWRLLLSRKACWAIIINHFSSNWTLYLMISWMPSYLHDVQHLNVGKAGLAAALPWATTFFTGNAAGFVADRLTARGVPVIRIRKVAQTIALLGGATGLLLASQATSATEAVAMLCLALGCNGIIAAGFASNHLDIAPRYAGPLYAMSNTLGTVPGIAGVYITGWLLDLTGGYTITFVLAAAVSVLGAGVWLAWATTDPIIE